MKNDFYSLLPSYLILFCAAILFAALYLNPIHQKHFEEKHGNYQVLIINKETGKVVKQYDNVDIKMLAEDDLIYETQVKLYDKFYKALVFDSPPENCFYKIVKNSK